MDIDEPNQEQQEQDQPQNSRRPQDQQKKKKKSLYDDFRQLKRVGKYISRAFSIVRNVASLFSPTTWIAIGIFLIILLLIIIIFFFNNKNDAAAPGGDAGAVENILPPGLSIDINPFDSQVSVTDNINYTITVTYDPAAATDPIENIVIYDPLPPNTEFVSATNPPCSLQGTTIECPLSNLPKPIPNTVNITIVLKPTADNVLVTNTIRARVETSVLGAATKVTASSQPSSSSENDCKGLYDLKNIPGNQNFGDPKCNFSKDKLYSLLKATDPENADAWYYKVATCQNYNPNAYSVSPATGEERFGLFLLHKSQGRKSRYDMGDVPWQDQVTNAIAHYQLLREDPSLWNCKDF